VRRGDDPATRRVLVLSGDILPYPGLPTSGAGLRAWGIANGLASAGHDVTLLMPGNSLAALDVPSERKAELAAWIYAPERCDEAIARWQPEVIVLQHWWLAMHVEASDLPLVIDLHGPLLLETLYQDLPHYEELAAQKIQALSRADFITCAGDEQRKYFYPWLMLAGFDLREPAIASVPVSLSPDLPPHRAEGEVSFVYGGIYLPWQNPLVALGALVERLEAHAAGRLHFFGGAHPVLKLAAAEYEAIERQLAASERVVSHGLVSHDRLLDEYRRAHVAFDVMARNPERELAFTTRTVEYLWCGLPVVYNDYAELARPIREYEAGWTVDPLDRAAIAAVVDTILDDPAEVERRSDNARRLARERLAWDRTIAPLDAFCRQPRKRRPHGRHLASLATRRDAAPASPDVVHGDLGLLIDQVEALAVQAQASASLLDGLAQRRLAPSVRLVDRAKHAAKRAVGIDGKLVLADHGATLAGDFADGVTHGQSFVRGDGAIYRIDVLFATYGRLNPSHIRFHLCEVTPAGFGPDLVTQTISAAQLLDNRFHAFVFPALPPAFGSVFAFWLDSPDARPGASVAVWQASAGPPAARQRYRDGRPVPGSLLFRLFERAASRAGPAAGTVAAPP
jgi:glycosyltransferase involved in cell wall biosynthesis